MKTAEDLRKIADKIRRETFTMIHHAGGGHFGGCLSVVEILTILYFDVMRINPAQPDWEDRDRLILSKGHAGPTLYCTLSNRGFFDRELLKELDQNGGRLAKHADRKVPGVDYSTGALGMGLSVGNGLAMAAKLDRKDHDTYVVLGDGELNEGQIWEAIMTAAQYKLDNLIVIVDRNFCQIDGTTEDIKALEPLKQKWIDFGWNAMEVDGHDLEALTAIMCRAKESQGKPSVIIANTTKGKGISFMEKTIASQVAWHAGTITPEDFAKEICIVEGK